MAELYLGTARARLGPAAALIDLERPAIAACEENRLTRAIESGTLGPPELAVRELLRYLGREATDIAARVSVDDTGDGDPHRAHAEYARVASGFEQPLCIVVGTTVTAWLGDQQIQVDAVRITAEYGALTARLGFRPTRDEHLVEALARGGHTDAASVQRKLGDDLLDLLRKLQEQTRATRVCLSGGLFFNTYFTTLVASCGLFGDTYVPPHPGRNGAALGGALLAIGRIAGRPSAALGAVRSPYLGPSYTSDEIKSTLENCKLSFDLVHDDPLFDHARRQIARGRLVGWYHGRLEWGPRALGHRSVLADPFAPHVLENLNSFLKRRPSFRPYGVSIPARRLGEFFEPAMPHAAGSPTASPFMQYEFRPKDAERFRTILPPGVHTLRVHTVDESEPRFLRLLETYGEQTGAPILVNTSFNGFHEPLVCSPRDAVRVFYGTGLDVLVLENFLLRK